MLYIVFLHILLILSISLIIVLSYKLVNYLKEDIKLVNNAIDAARKSKHDLLDKYSNN